MKTIYLLSLFTILSIVKGSATPNHHTVLSEDNVPISLRVDNENLFIYLESGNNDYLKSAVIHLNKGKKIKLTPVAMANGQTVFYLDSKEAYKLKKFGIRNVTIKSEDRTVILKLSTTEKDKITRSLP